MPDIEIDVLKVISKLFEGYLDAGCSINDNVGLKVLYQGNALLFIPRCATYTGWRIHMHRPILAFPGSPKMSEETIIEGTNKILPYMTSRTRLHSSEAWGYTYYITKECLEAIDRDEKLKSLSLL